MNDHLINSLVTVLTAIVGVAIIAVLVSQRAKTSDVIGAAGSAFANDLAAAVSPVTGSQVQINTGSSSFSGFTGLGAPLGISNF